MSRAKRNRRPGEAGSWAKTPQDRRIQGGDQAVGGRDEDRRCLPVHVPPAGPAVVGVPDEGGELTLSSAAMTGDGPGTGPLLALGADPVPVEAFGQHPLETTAGAARQAHRGGTGREQGGDDALQQGRHRVVGRGQQPRIHVQLTQLPGPGVGPHDDGSHDLPEAIGGHTGLHRADQLGDGPPRVLTHRWEARSGPAWAEPRRHAAHPPKPRATPHRCRCRCERWPRRDRHG